MVYIKTVSSSLFKNVGRFKIFKHAALKRWKEVLWILPGEKLPKGVTEEALGPEKTAEYLAKNAAYRSKNAQNARHLARNQKWREKRK